jgi:hypothetical protein
MMNFREMMQQLIIEQLPVQVIAGTVLSLDRAGACIDVQPLDESAPKLLDVRLRAVDDGKATGFIQWPKEGSVVLVGLIGNDINTAFVVAASEVETFTLSTEQESLLTWLQDFGQLLIGELVLLTNQGPTVGLAPNSLQAVQQLFARLPNLFTA